MKPLIGISCGIEKNRLILHQDYLQAVVQAGGQPLAGEFGEQKEDLAAFAGIILSGGDDLDPLYWGEEPRPGLKSFDPRRDRREIELVKNCRELGLPLLGICRGMQIINIALGGDLYQDLPSQKPDSFLHWQTAERHFPTHFVQIKPQSRLAQITGQEKRRVNSFHHQAIRKCALDLQITASAGDNVAEALENRTGSWILGVQWHPEALADDSQIFAAFMEACKTAAEDK